MPGFFIQITNCFAQEPFDFERVIFEFERFLCKTYSEYRNRVLIKIIIVQLYRQ